ncbi:MAG: hypothetical protein JRL30_28255, partial [Deltaproteobacteria bacterium]|nr:hypothetical protein [Deltaproteobacteria bacterium]
MPTFTVDFDIINMFSEDVVAKDMKEAIQTVEDMASNGEYDSAPKATEMKVRVQDVKQID